MKYTAGEVRARVNKAWQDHDEQGRVFITMGDAMALVETILPERIEADEVGVSAPKRQYYYRVDGCTATDATDPKCICWHDEGTGPLAHGDYLPKSWRVPPAQAAQSVDIEAIREVIESHINEAKNLRHDPELQDYLYEQADKLEAALQEKGNG